MRKLLTLIAIVFATTAACCDQAKHDVYEQMQQNVAVCMAKNGIPILDAKIDDGGHTFTVLTSCSFPCDQRLTVEK